MVLILVELQTVFVPKPEGGLMKKAVLIGAALGVATLVVWLVRAPQADTREIRRREQRRQSEDGPWAFADQNKAS